MPGEVAEPAAPPPAVKAKKRLSPVVLGGAAAGLLVLVGGGFILTKKIFAPPPPPPPAVVKPKPAAKSAPAPAAKSPAAPLTPSNTLNAVAHAPVNAINKAQAAIDARRAGEQSKVDGLVTAEDPANKVAAPAAPKLVETESAIAPGISATNSNIAAMAEASVPFRSFVANAKIPGVFPGDPPRAMINNRLTRAGDIVDAGLGITFDGVDPDKRQIIFKDKSGAIVTRRY